MTVMTKMMTMGDHRTRSASGWHISTFVAVCMQLLVNQATVLSGLELQMNKFFAVNFISYIEANSFFPCSKCKVSGYQGEHGGN